MAATASKTLNIYQKLAKARLDFLKKHIQKSGVNSHAEFEYFELSDIVPIGTEILNDNKLLFVTTFPNGVPTGTLYDMESEQTIVFNCDKVEGDIEGIKGGKMMISIQSEGAKQTYHRRYLWLQMLDIVLQDEIDGKDFSKDKTEPAQKKPVTEEQRAEIKKELTDSSAPADELQIDQLKKALKQLNECEGDFEEFIVEIATKTKNFTTLSKENCTKLILQVGELIEEAKRGVVQ